MPGKTTNNWRARAFALGTTILTVLGGTFGAAWAQQLPPSINPGRIQERFEQPQAPRVDPRIEVPQVQPALPPEQARRIRFVLRGVEVNGSTAYAPGQLDGVYQSYVGKEISALEAYEIANAITARYRTDGYVLTQAFIPQQQLRDGVLKIQVVEGRINRVIIRDKDGNIYSHNYFLQYAERLKSSQPLKQEELERYLLLLNDFPGMRVSGVLSPSDQPGTADLIVEATYKRVDLYATIDNRGSRYLGPYQTEFSAAYNGLLDVGDRILYRYVVSLFQPNELQFHEARYQTPFLGYGTVFEAWGNWARTRPGFTLKDLDIEGQSYSWNFRFKHPIIRSRAMNLWAYGGFSWQNSENDVLTATISDDRLRVIRFGATFEAVDALRGVNYIDIQVSQGLDGMGARGNSREFGRVEFTKVNLDYQRNQQIWGPVSAFFQFSGQYAGTQLLAPEEFGLGGRTFGRAFDPSEKTGDHGLAVSLELRYTLDEFRAPLLDVPTSLQFFGFGDWGRVYHIDSRRKTFETLASAGVGMRFNLGRSFSGQVEGAVPLYGRPQAMGTEGQDWRVFFVLNARY